MLSQMPTTGVVGRSCCTLIARHPLDFLLKLLFSEGEKEIDCNRFDISILAYRMWQQG